MADSSSTAQAGLDALVKSIVGSIEATGATEQAIHQQAQTVLGATTQAIETLVKTNSYSPELAQENLKLQKTMIDRTIAAINALTPPSGETGGGTGGGRQGGA